MSRIHQACRAGAVCLALLPALGWTQSSESQGTVPKATSGEGSTPRRDGTTKSGAPSPAADPAASSGGNRKKAAPTTTPPSDSKAGSILGTPK